MHKGLPRLADLRLGTVRRDAFGYNDLLSGQSGTRTPAHGALRKQVNA